MFFCDISVSHSASGAQQGLWSGCHMKFIGGDRRKQLNVLMLFLSIVEICDGDYFCFA